MGASQLPAWVLLLALGAGPNHHAPAGPGRPLPGGELSAEDARYLDWIVEDFLFDPRRATYVRVTSPGARDVLESRNSRFLAADEDRTGWLVRGTNGDPDRVYFTDGESVVVSPDRLRHLDFEALCADNYAARLVPFPTEFTKEVAARLALIERARRLDGAETSSLVAAAWLHRRGYDRLAAAALAHARERERDDAREELRAGLARRASDAAVRAFAARDDAAAVAHAARLHALYPDQAEHYPQAAAVVADVTRRQRTGIGSREPPRGPPPGFAGWDAARRVAFLIGSLDEAERGGAWQWYGGYFGEAAIDWRTSALVDLGDAAVPALIDALEHDTRLTRQSEVERLAFSCGRGGRRPEQVATVRDLANDVLRSVLRVREFDPTAPVAEDDEEDRSPRATTDRLRRYWARYGRLAFPDRMMAVLTDPAARPSARREAAECLVFADDGRASSWDRDDRRRPTGPSPLVAKYTRPTVAEAVLAAMDRERETQTDDERRTNRWDVMGGVYLRILIRLGDVRVGPELARRAVAATRPVQRLGLAEAAAALGVRGPIVGLAREVAAGTVTFPPPTDQDRPPADRAEANVRELVEALVDARLPETDAALYALADPGHPYFPMALAGALTDADHRGRERQWKRHPLCLTVLRHGLADPRPSGRHSYRRGNEVENWNGRKSQWWTPPGGADPERWAEHVEHRAGDEAAARLNELVVGLAEYHPLRRDADRTRAEVRDFVVRHAGRFRPISYDEMRRWDVWLSGEPAYVPDLKPLGRPATAADVAAGRAVFELNGAGRVADLKLPTWVVLKADAGRPGPPAGLVVQAEVGADGQVAYGVIFRRSIRAVRADEVEAAERR